MSFLGLAVSLSRHWPVFHNVLPLYCHLAMLDVFSAASAYIRAHEDEIGHIKAEVHIQMKVIRAYTRAQKHVQMKVMRAYIRAHVHMQMKTRAGCCLIWIPCSILLKSSL